MFYKNKNNYYHQSKLGRYIIWLHSTGKIQNGVIFYKHRWRQLVAC